MDILDQSAATDVRALFDTLVRAEPGFAPDLATAQRRVRRLRYRRRAGMALAGAGSAAVTVAALVTFAGPPDDPTTVIDDPSRATAPAVQPAQPAPEPFQVTGVEPTTEGGRRILDALQAASPAGWSFELLGDDETSIVGTVDDGNGPGYTVVSAQTPPGVQQLHPCQDPEFARGVDCTETVVADGSVLSRRAMDRDGDTTTVHVILTRPDGTGTGVHSTNVAPTRPAQEAAELEAGRQPNTVVTRDEPPYTLDQLTDLVIAIDQATR